MCEIRKKSIVECPSLSHVMFLMSQDKSVTNAHECVAVVLLFWRIADMTRLRMTRPGHVIIVIYRPWTSSTAQH